MYGKYEEEEEEEEKKRKKKEKKKRAKIHMYIYTIFQPSSGGCKNTTNVSPAGP